MRTETVLPTATAPSIANESRNHSEGNTDVCKGKGHIIAGVRCRNREQ
jgi:hypothetical protein